MSYYDKDPCTKMKGAEDEPPLPIYLSIYLSLHIYMYIHEILIGSPHPDALFPWNVAPIDEVKVILPP
jgi:hypothetical protein